MKKLTVKHRIGEGPGDMAAEWMTEDDWKKHREYVEQTKKDGTYGQEVESTIMFVEHPLFDKPQGSVIDLESVKIITFKPIDK